MCESILVVDDSLDIRFALRSVLQSEGMEVTEVGDGETALRMMRQKTPDVVLLDFRMPGMDGHELLRRAKALDGGSSIIVLTAYGDVKDAVLAMKEGAYDYMTKPFDNKDVVLTIRMALNESFLKKKVSRLPSIIEGRLCLHEVMGRSEKVLKLQREVARVAPTNFSVLIIGETGVGKELVARAIHAQSKRAGSPFVAMDCGAISETLIESELFGYEKGAFTGAETTRPGKLDAASGGTLFLDEISNLPLSMQSKLLRILQEKQFYRVGGVKTIKANVRLIAATNVDIELQGDDSTLRRDLFHRVSEYIIHVPPLRERKEDIEFLTGWFLERTNAELRKSVTGFSETSVRMMLEYDWPGNVRELRNVIRRAMLLAERSVEVEHLGMFNHNKHASCGIVPAETLGWHAKSFKEILARHISEIERKVIAGALKQSGGNIAEAARMLKVDYKTIHTKIKKYQLKAKGDANGSKE